MIILHNDYHFYRPYIMPMYLHMMIIQTRVCAIGCTGLWERGDAQPEDVSVALKSNWTKTDLWIIIFIIIIVDWYFRCIDRWLRCCVTGHTVELGFIAGKLLKLMFSLVIHLLEWNYLDLSQLPRDRLMFAVFFQCIHWDGNSFMNNVYSDGCFSDWLCL